MGVPWFRAPFCRSRSVVKECFTGQSPGKAISIPAAPDVQGFGEKLVGRWAVSIYRAGAGTVQVQ